MKRNAIRTLRPNEPIPTGQPKRYTDGRGYIRLRWLVGVQQYVEEYEHRIVMGRPSDHVHHLNGDKADNRPENLVVLTNAEHARLHAEDVSENHQGSGRVGSKRFESDHIGVREAKALRAQARRDARRQKALAMREAYEAGEGTVSIGERFSMSPGGVSRALRQVGTRMRKSPTSTGPSQDVRQVVKARACLQCERCGRNVAWEHHEIHHRRARAAGGTRRPETNSPTNLVLLCQPCHRHVESYPEEARSTGFRVDQRQNPADLPLCDLEGCWWLLDDDGCKHRITLPFTHPQPGGTH